MNTTKKMSSHILRTVICFTLVMVILTLLSGTVQAKSKYPKVHSTGEVTLAKGYYFVPPPEDIEGVPSWKKYALIHKGRNSTYVVKVRVPYHYDMCFVGKYKKKYYFNMYSVNGKCKAVYTYKLGAKKFKRVKKKICLYCFKNYKYPDSWFKHGVKSGRYVTATSGWPTDFRPMPKLYVYDLEKNKARFVGKKVAKFKRFGKRIYYVQQTLNDDFETTKFTIKYCKLNGSGRRLKKTIPIDNKNVIGIKLSKNLLTVTMYDEDYNEYKEYYKF